MSAAITITAAAFKDDRYLVIARNGVGEIHRDKFDLNSDSSRTKFVGRTMSVAFKGTPPDDWPDGVRDELHDQLLKLAAVPPGPAEPETKSQPEGEEPWADQVDGAELLDEIAEFIRGYIVLPEYAPEVLALWLLHTYAPDAGGGYTPYIWVSSPVRECGKSTLLELLSELAFRGQMTGGITAAALYRRIHRACPTMLLDELDTRLKGEGGEGLRGVLNTGFHRTGKVTICVGDGHEDTDFNTFCPKVLAGIGRLWDTVSSRSVPIRLRRASKPELKGLRKIRGDRIGTECRPFRRKLLRVANDVSTRLAGTEAVTPEELTARQSDVWRPLLSIASVVGGHWPLTAPAAAIAIHSITGDEGDYGLLLLEDLRELFHRHDRDALFSEFIVQELVKREDRPWPEYRGDKPITKNGLASLLKRFEVRPLTVRVDDETAKGYRLKDLGPVFKVYLPPSPPPNEPSQPSQTGISPETDGIPHDVSGWCDGWNEPSQTGHPSHETVQKTPENPLCDGCDVSSGSGRGGPTPFGTCSGCGAKCGLYQRICPKCLEREGITELGGG